MSKFEKLLLKVVTGVSDHNISFSDLILILTTLGFEFRVKGSHHIFFKEGVEEIINIQPNGDKAKPYQVKQVRNLLIKYKLIDL
ncbi:MAG: type II toxin-antitoxin system HicA family toxin [Leadbetterella sp.]|nr:type II toxin-antitoxin system HicA family toxin [Leadbetterella sp.]